MDRITGTLLHYLRICPRKIWLMAHELSPDEDHPLLELGRFLSDQAYSRQSLRQIQLPGVVIDWVEAEGDELLVAEVKTSSRALSAARLQVLFYLQQLEEHGIRAKGEIRIPKERKRVEVTLDAEARSELEDAIREVSRIMYQPMSPPAQRVSHCFGCGYGEFCWTE